MQSGADQIEGAFIGKNATNTDCEAEGQEDEGSPFNTRNEESEEDQPVIFPSDQGYRQLTNVPLLPLSEESKNYLKSIGVTIPQPQLSDILPKRRHNRHHRSTTNKVKPIEPKTQESPTTKTTGTTGTTTRAAWKTSPIPPKRRSTARKVMQISH